MVPKVGPGLKSPGKLPKQGRLPNRRRTRLLPSLIEQERLATEGISQFLQESHLYRLVPSRIALQLHHQESHLYRLVQVLLFRVQVGTSAILRVYILHGTSAGTITDFCDISILVF